MEEPLAPTSGFQRRSWAIQRVGWGAIGAWLLASAAGWTGPGPGSRERVATLEPGISIHYERVLHLDAPTRLVVLVERGETGALDLALGGAYANSFRVQELVPAPRTESVGGRERRFTLEIDRTGPARLELALVPLAWGWQTGALSVDGRPVATLRHLVLP